MFPHFLFAFFLNLVLISDFVFEMFWGFFCGVESIRMEQYSNHLTTELLWLFVGQLLAVIPVALDGPCIGSSWSVRPLFSLLVGLFCSLLVYCRQDIKALQYYQIYFMNLRLHVNIFHHFVWSWLPCWTSTYPYEDLCNWEKSDLAKNQSQAEFLF